MITDDTRPGEPAGSSGFEPAQADGWRWLFSDDADVAVEVLAPTFDSRQSAESWVDQNYESLLDQGVAAVSLFDATGAVYGPVPLVSEELGPDGTEPEGTEPEGPGPGRPAEPAAPGA